MSAPDWAAQARELVAEWLRADFHGPEGMPGAAMLERLLEARLSAAYARGHRDGMEDAAKLAITSYTAGMAHTPIRIATSIRTLAQLPGGEDSEDGGSDER